MIRVIDTTSQQVIKEFSYSESQLAYELAAQMEELGVEVKIESISTAESLADALGANEEVKAQLRKTLEDEIESHEGSCCFKKSE